MSITMNTELKIPKTESEETAALQRMEEWSKKSLTMIKERIQVSEETHLDNCSVFVTGFALDTTCDMLETFFSQFGKVIEVYIPFDCQANSKGYGFITFDSLKDQQTVLAQSNFEFNNKTIIVRPAFKKRHGATQGAFNAIQRSFRIHVSSLPKRIERSDIINYFTQFGNVKNVFQYETHTLYDSNLNFCFVTFDEMESVKKVLDQKCHKLMDQEIVVKTYISKHEQKAKEVVDSLDLVGPSKRIAELMKNLVAKEEATLANSSWSRNIRGTLNF